MNRPFAVVDNRVLMSFFAFLIGNHLFFVNKKLFISFYTIIQMNLLAKFRKKYRQLLRNNIAQTVAAPEDLEEELRHLFAVLSGA